MLTPWVTTKAARPVASTTTAMEISTAIPPTMTVRRRRLERCTIDPRMLAEWPAPPDGPFTGSFDYYCEDGTVTAMLETGP